MLPFTSTQFFDIFGAYNNAIWPMQAVIYGLAFVAMAMLFRPGIATDRFITAILALMWTWTGIGYHWLHFYAINPVALLFGVAFVVQGVIFLIVGTRQGNIRFKYSRGMHSAIGVAFILYASIIYPAIGTALGHSYPNAPVFGVTPCPVTIFTFGCLLLLRSPTKWWVIAIPVLWSLVGGTAAILLEVSQDWLLLASGVTTAGLLAKSWPPLLH